MNNKIIAIVFVSLSIIFTGVMFSLQANTSQETKNTKTQIKDTLSQEEAEELQANEDANLLETEYSVPNSDKALPSPNLDNKLNIE